MNVYNYVFFLNPHTDLWYAIPRDLYVDFFNGNVQDGHVLKAKDIMVLVQIIQKGEEFIKSI